MPHLTPFRQLARSRFGAFLALLLTVVLFACGDRGETRDSAALLDELIGSAAREHRLEVRLSSTLPYAPRPSGDVAVQRSAAMDERRRLLAAARTLTARAAASPSAENLAALGLAHLVLGDADRAVGLLERAATLGPEDPALASDLAAAYLERAGTDRPLDLVRALAAVESAHQLAADDPGVCFNRALALERLHLRDDARQAWQRYLELESDPAWRSVAGEHLELLLVPSTAELWAAERPQLVELAANGPSTKLRELVERFPQPTRELVENDLLASWADALVTGDLVAAQRSLDAARTLATALVNVTGDPLLRDAVAVIDEADPERRHRLAHGHRLYRDGRGIYETLDYERAQPVLEQAARVLTRAGSPFAAWAELYSAVCLYWREDRQSALESFASLHASYDAKGYLTLLGYCDWMRGVIHHLEADQLGLALGFYQEALKSFEQARQLQNVASVRYLLAEHFVLLGDARQVWRNLLEALSLAEEVLNPRHLHTILKQAADAALSEDLPFAALTFLDRGVEVARQHPNPGVAAEALLSRARTHHRLGHAATAAADLAAARERMEAVADPNARRRVEGQLLVAEARVFDGGAALEALDRALAYYAGSSFDALAAQLYLARGRAHRALGNVAAAETDFVAGIEIYERLRPTLLEEQLRISYFDQAQDLFDVMIDLQVDRGDSERALELAERSRSRELLASLTVQSPERGELPKTASTAEIRAGLPSGTVLLVYALLDDRLMIWTVSHDELRSKASTVNAGELTGQVDALVDQLQTGVFDRSKAEQLYEVLIAPVADTLRGVNRVVILADKALHALPFGVLVDPATGRHLIADHALAFAPSATILLRSSSPANATRSVDPVAEPILILGDPSFDTQRFPNLPRLPGALEEARTIAASYGQPVFTGEEATRELLFARAGEASIVHLAVHAVANEAFPLLSQLVLAPGKNDPGVVFAHELLGLPLARVRLVVLAACSTGSGRISRSEGALSLARPFLAAGVPAVVASLWKIDDRQSAALFRLFYDQLHSGAEPIDALRQAQLELLAAAEPDEGVAAWAGFQIFIGALAPSR